MQIPVIVTDKQGNYLPGLGKADFELFNDGHPQDIDTFAAPNLDSSTNQTAGPLPANTYSNRRQPIGAAPPSVTAILIDGLNNRFESLANARNQTLEFLRTLGPRDAVTLYYLGNRLYLLHDFSKGNAGLLADLKNYKPETGTRIEDWTPSAEPPLPRPPGSQPRASVSIVKTLFPLSDDVWNLDQQSSADRTLEALRQITIHLGSMPGRKNLIWISGTFPTADVYVRVDGNLGSALQQHSATAHLAEMMNAFDIALYPVEPAGLSYRPSHWGSAPAAQSTQLVMWELAEHTGGLSFYSSKDMERVLRHAMEDLRNTYLLGVYPQPGHSPEKFHKITVKVNRPETVVRSRAGFSPQLESGVAALFSAEIFEEARRSPLEATGIGLVAHSEIAEEGDSRFLDLELAVDPQDLQLQAGEKGPEAKFFLEFTQHNSVRMVMARSVSSVRFAMTADLYRIAKVEGIKLSNKIPLREGANSVRIVVSDVNGENIGSLTIPVRNLKRDSNQ
ncbi:MAG: VWA domain-containing protein [Candidatus Acidiferrales bacterium]